MEEISLDVAIIGIGTAGRFALGPVSEKTENFRIFEGGGEGTTCARIGCMPSKAFIHVADMVKSTDSFPDMGIQIDDLHVDGKKAMRYVREKRDALVKDTIKKYDYVRDKVVNEYAQFVAPMTLKAGGNIYRCKSIIIATGSKPIIPRGWHLVPNRIITTDAFFEQNSIPDSALVVGLGFIGIEIGQALSRMGSKVTGAEMLDAVAGLQDPEIEKELRALVGEEIAIKMKTMAFLDSVGDDVGVTLRNTETGEEEKCRFDLVILATGRKPNLQYLKLENSDLGLDNRGVPAHDEKTLQCSDQRVFIAGDANGVKPLQHEGADEGVIAGRNAVADDELAKLKRRVPLQITFTDPNSCSVGKRYNELEPDSFVIAEGDFRLQGRAHIMDIYKGKLHVYIDKKTRKIVGAELVAPGGEHIAHLIGSFIAAGLTIDEAVRLPYYHPTLEEALAKALGEALGELR